VYFLPLHACGATTQGEIGYLLQQALAEALAEREIGRPVATVLTQVVVSASDPAFRRPTKPIGPFYTRAQADERRRDGWTLVEDPVHGFRRVVASPEPLEIVEAEVIRALVDRGVLVVALGGGGVPVIRRGNRLIGVDAVIDKDLASALLACRLGVERLVISTTVDYIAVDYGLPSERPLRIVTAEQLERYHRDGQFPAGSMGPKVEAALRFLRDGGSEVVVTSPTLLREAVMKGAGTHVVTGAPTGSGQPVAAMSGWTSGR